MGKYLIALAASLLIAAQILTPVSASAAYDSGPCGDTYIVQHLDNLSKIAKKCDTTVASILDLNHQIKNPNIIYTGQELRLTGKTAKVYTGTPQVSLSDTTVDAGDTITVRVSGFPANMYIDYRVGLEDEDYSVVYDGIVDSEGKASITITIPTSADYGDYWVVLVTTTGQREGIEVYSATIFITG